MLDETIRTVCDDRLGDSPPAPSLPVRQALVRAGMSRYFYLADLNETGYSPPMWAPFSATERRMSRTVNINSKPTAAEKENTSK